MKYTPIIEEIKQKMVVSDALAVQSLGPKVSSPKVVLISQKLLWDLKLFFAISKILWDLKEFEISKNAL